MEGSFRILLLLTGLSACNLLLLGVGGAQHLNNETDRQALMAFKGEIDDDPYGVLSSWNNSMHFCDWQGVICGSRHQRVVGINLGSFLELKGRISPHIANLTVLRFISLPNNRLHGEIPHELGRLPRLAALSLGNNSLEGAIPATLSNCSNLQSILLNSNRLAGQVPPELGLLSRLRGFLIGGNRFTGVFPPFLTNLTSLTNLSLALNSFHGEIPEGIGKLSGLRRFLLGGNNFSGELPSTIYNLSNMLAIDLPQNQLSGVLSPRMGDLFPKLQHVNLLYNYFSGRIPVSLSNASDLRSLTFAGNGFVGSIPSDVGKLQDLFWFDFADNLLGAGSGDDLLFLITSLTNCTKLTLLGLGNNTLLGQLPASIANLSRNIFELSLGYNFIHGRIPPGFENILSLERFSLTSNFLTGHIPAEFGQLQNLGDISLYQNNLEGQIPVSLGNLSHLVLFSLGQNQLQGRIPASLGNCSNLQRLGLLNNALSGSIPSQLFNLKSLITFDLSSNLLSGNLPSEVGQLQNLNEMDLSSNNLSGSIPTSLGNCRSLVSLNLSHNSFASAIPMSLAAMSAVDEVDLSSNNLTGVIPTNFTNFNLLRILNLSFNDLEGEVPTLGPFKNVSRVSVLGNNKLCGGVLELHLPSCFKTNDTRGHKGRLLLLKLILPLAIGTSTLIFVCCVLAYYRRKWSRNDPTPFISMNQQHMQVTYAELHRATNGFSAANLIGSGSFGSVFRGTLIDSYQMDVAIKVINSVEHASLQSFTAECDALKKVRHRNVVKILTSCSSLDFQGNEFRALVFKFMPNGSLDSWVHPTFGQDLYLSFRRRLDIAMDVANAMDYLHNHGETPIVHCDLKPNNILLDGEMVAHVSDFGLAKVLLDVGDDSSCRSMLKGSIGYIPPEYGASYTVTPHGDVYSYGVLLLELFTGKRPTDELFRDGIDISKYAERHFHGRLMETVDQTLLLRESNEHNHAFQDCLSCVIGIGISCTSELPQKRKKMSSVCMELEAAIEKYKKEQMKTIDG